MSLYDVAQHFGSWQDDDIWSLDAKPTAGQDAYIAAATAIRVTSDDDVTVNSVGVAYDDQLLINNGSTLTATDGTVLGANDQGHSYGIDGTVFVGSGSTFSVGDALVNFGTIAVDDLGSGGSIVLNGAVTFTGIGMVALGGENTSFQFFAGDITGDSLSNEGNTIEGGGLISLSSLDNVAGAIIAEQIGGDWLTISAATFTNEATLEARGGATLDLGLVGATQALTNSGVIDIGYNDGNGDVGNDATLAISGNYTIGGDGGIDFGGDNAAIVSDLSAGDVFTNESSIHANFSGNIGNGAAVPAAFNLTFDNDGDVYATGENVVLTIDTGANTVTDAGGLLEADDNGMLIIDSPVQMGVYYLPFGGGGTSPSGGTIEATTGGDVEIASTVANGPPSRFEREASGQVVVDSYSTIIVASGGDIAVPVVIEAGGILEYLAGGEVTGSVTFEGADAEFEFGQSNTPSGEISGYQDDDTIVISGLDIAYRPVDPYEPLPSTFTLALNGDVLTQANSDGSTQVSTYAITGQSFTQKAVDTNASGQVVAKYFSGVTGEGDLSAFEYLYAGNNLVGTNEWYSNITGQAYTNEEIDYDGAGAATRLAFSGLSESPYYSYELDYVGGVFAGSRFDYLYGGFGTQNSYDVDYGYDGGFVGEDFFFRGVTGQSYTGEEEDFDANLKLSRVVLTGVQDQAYSSLELDYNAGTYAGYKAFYAITGENFTNEEVDVSAAGQLQKIVYSGLTGAPYQTVEQDYVSGALADTIYGYTDVTGETYNAYQLTEDASGDALVETFDLNAGGHTQIALTANQTLTSLGNDKMTGSATGSTTFVFNAIYGADAIANLTSADQVSLPGSEFASFDDLMKAATNVGGDVVIAAADGDTLTLKGMSKTTLAELSSDFSFHA